ncbi:hypothetical protein [uncultured Sunxiuqinia sp.]|uniref:hypothetical protein n=1 Tax=uncultured Sunxiuqinia sp. TaxID=1573825 RepID=UPI002AA68BFD|nr:hypothetical protein [uncultured Sunxiuqinia sp.]
MLDFKVILEIREKAIDSMKCDSDDESITSLWKKTIFIIFFYIAPIAVCVIAWIRDVKLTALENYIGTGIAIFTGLFFSLLLSIGAKVRSEKENPNKDADNFQQFKTNMKQIANITLYIIVAGIIIFLLLLLNTLLKSEDCLIVEKIFTTIVLFFLTRFIVSLFFMIQRFYFLVRDEINNIL